MFYGREDILADLSALSAGSLGVSEIARKLGRGKNGHLSKTLETLEVSGFVDEVRKKVARLGLKRSETVRTALVYEGRLSPKVEGDGCFDAVVPIERLFT